MSNVQAYIPAMSLVVGSIISAPFNTQREVMLRSTWQPPGWVFFVAWTLQAVSLGFVGQGIGDSSDTVLKGLWIGFASSLGPLYALSTQLKNSNRVPQTFALTQDLAYVTGLLIFLTFIIQRSYQTGTKQNYLFWPTFAWIAFALFLTGTAQAQFANPSIRRLRTQQIAKLQNA